MATGGPQTCVSLWKVQTRASVVGCTLTTFNEVLCELRILQDADVIIAERFTSEASARAYADTLYEQIARLAPQEARPDERKAG